MNYLVWGKGSSGIHVESVRCFSNETKARKYYEERVSGRSWHEVKGYEVSDSAPPKLIWSCAKDKNDKK